MAVHIEARLHELGITLPKPAVPQANNVPCVRTDNRLFIAGQVPSIDGRTITGKLGAGVDIATGQMAARTCALNLIIHALTACDSDLDRVVRWPKFGGSVQGTPDFTDAPQVVNDASGFMVEVFGEAGKQTRFAVAVACLPLDAAVEVDAVLEIR